MARALCRFGKGLEELELGEGAVRCIGIVNIVVMLRVSTLMVVLLLKKGVGVRDAR